MSWRFRVAKRCETLRNAGVSQVQKMRKDTKLNQDDPVDMWAQVKPGKASKGLLQKSMTLKRDYIIKLLRRLNSSSKH